MSKLSTRLKKLRAKRDWSLSKAAAHAGCTKAHLWELEAGRQDNPGLKLLLALSKAYDINIRKLVEGL